ncbi:MULTISPECIES: hypothetical protein [Salinibaculum]|uniref:hypothetical protein n=1 Tax=Salinibaculum TaxID=2732368 RepID=UPI0030CBA7E6
MDDDSGISADLEDRLREHRSGTDDTPGRLALSDAEGYVGDTITLRGRDLAPDREYEVVWHSTDGEWAVLRAHEILGPQYTPRTDTIATPETDDAGAFDAEWTVPEDYGGVHRIEVRDDGEAVASAEFEVTPWFELDRTTAPMGEMVTVTGYGLGPDVSTNNYQIAWDNGYVGYMTGVMNRGTATAQIRAVGPPGEHVVQVWRNYRGIPYVANNTQSPMGPVAGGRQSVWTVEVTEPEEPPETAWVDPLFEENPIELHYPDLDADTDAELDVTPRCGTAGTSAVITGTGFPPKAEVDLQWYQHVGEGIRGTNVTPKPRPGVLPAVTADADGRFQVDVEIPVAEGSTRPIVAEVDGESVAVTGFMMQPSIATYEPTSGPVGTEIEIELSGIGWTNYENSPFFVYDNKALGYACGLTDEFRSTTVRTVLRAAGEPGWHFIDVYPSLFEMEEKEPEFEVKPHLSYLDNHPVRPLPGFHFAFEITE